MVGSQTHFQGYLSIGRRDTHGLGEGRDTDPTTGKGDPTEKMNLHSIWLQKSQGHNLAIS